MSLDSRAAWSKYFVNRLTHFKHQASLKQPINSSIFSSQCFVLLSFASSTTCPPWLSATDCRKDWSNSPRFYQLLESFKLSINRHEHLVQASNGFLLFLEDQSCLIQCNGSAQPFDQNDWTSRDTWTYAPTRQVVLITTQLSFSMAELIATMYGANISARVCIICRQEASILKKGRKWKLSCPEWLMELFRE